MRRIIEYMVIYHDILCSNEDDEDIEFRMKDEINHGWQPYGSPTFDLKAEEGIYIAQAMVKYEQGMHQSVDWASIVPRLTLDALAKQLARQCKVVVWGIRGRFIQLELPNDQKPLLTERQKARLKSGLEEFLGIDITLSIVLGEELN